MNCSSAGSKITTSGNDLTIRQPSQGKRKIDEDIESAVKVAVSERPTRARKPIQPFLPDSPPHHAKKKRKQPSKTACHAPVSDKVDIEISFSKYVHRWWKERSVQVRKG
jgi:hypothetical protein